MAKGPFSQQHRAKRCFWTLGPVTPGLPLSIELGAALRYTGFRLRVVDEPTFGPAAITLTFVGLTLNISKV